MIVEGKHIEPEVTERGVWCGRQNCPSWDSASGKCTLADTIVYVCIPWNKAAIAAMERQANQERANTF